MSVHPTKSDKARNRRTGVFARGSKPVIGRRSYLPVLALLTIAVPLSLGANLSLGAFDIAPDRVAAIVGDHFGFGEANVGRRDDAVVWSIRFPRALLAALVGAGLGVAGALLQGIFRNPLAEPSVIGVSGGATVGAVSAIALGLSAFGVRTVALLAFFGGLVAAVLVFLLGRINGRSDVVTLVLVGIALSLLAQAITGAMTFIADDDELRSIVFWSLGSVSGATWEIVGAVAPFMLAGLAVAMMLGQRLNVLSLGDRVAGHLGVAVERTRFAALGLAALLTGVGVAVAGIVGFVGLIVPHIMRLLLGPDHRRLVPASMLAGATLVMLADLAARTIVEPSEIPLGVVTALVGGPYFLYLIRRTEVRVAGWT